jgi:hypothetical protein
MAMIRVMDELVHDAVRPGEERSGLSTIEDEHSTIGCPPPQL